MYRHELAKIALFGLALAVVGCAPDAAADQVPMADGTDMALAAAIADAPTIKVYKSPTCGCCSLWVDHMREAGFELDVEDSMQMPAIKADAGLPPQLQSCHTAFVGDYLLEGHIPADVIARFLSEKPDVRGLAVPGMPLGSPGMEMGDTKHPYDVIAFDDEGNQTVYESR